ncbi:esterase/lipase family protein [Crateriforma spongiae]|uniref:esterase/lipase family protein n=1 Tax=Crateriforma spongiae TaxID=2724528 RepID=UPI00144852F9|nr:hypothetical protein [Crateriforma spongiae]
MNAPATSQDLSANHQIRRVILVHGLLEPAWALGLIGRFLNRHGLKVEYWHDRLAFRRLDESVDRLASTIASVSSDTPKDTALVTHSFGDWVSRAAIAKTSHHRVGALVSLAPVMKAGVLPTLAWCVSRNLMPEIAVIMNAEQAQANLDCDPDLRRLVIWAKPDESLRQCDLSHLSNVTVRQVWATHLTIVLQPNVHRMIGSFLQR